MQKIIIVLVLFFITYKSVHSQSMNGENKEDERIARLTQDEKLTELVKSPDGKWIAFVKKSKFIIPSDCTYFFAKGDQADEIWIIDTTKMTKKLLVAPHFDCEEVSKLVIDPHHLQFSPDSTTIYFETSAWVTSSAVHAVDTDGKNLRFVTDGSDLKFVQSGTYKGNIIVNRHRYHFKGDNPLGSSNDDWLLTPIGKQIKLYKKQD